MPCEVSPPSGFNTQPPEGGWLKTVSFSVVQPGFNTQPPEGGCQRYEQKLHPNAVSTHSRLKAAGHNRPLNLSNHGVSTHSRLKAAAAAHAVQILVFQFQHTAA